MMLYALGALELFDGIYDIDTVRMAIYQPRRENVSVCVFCHDAHADILPARLVDCHADGINVIDAVEQLQCTEGIQLL